MNRITPHLWFDREAKKAADFYVATFPDLSNYVSGPFLRFDSSSLQRFSPGSNK